MYASSVGLFLLYHWPGNVDGVRNVGALALDGSSCGHGCRHGLVGVGGGNGGLGGGGWEDVC